MTSLGACDCPTCPDRGVIVELGPAPHRCGVCGWLLRRIPDHPDEEATNDAAP